MLGQCTVVQVFTTSNLFKHHDMWFCVAVTRTNHFSVFRRKVFKNVLFL